MNKSLRAWANEYEATYGIVIYDPDGFDRTDRMMWARRYQGIVRSISGQPRRLLDAEEREADYRRLPLGTWDIFGRRRALT